MSRKSGKVAEILARYEQSESRLDPHYLAYFDCFNQQLFYDSHDVLEQLWLADRHGPNGSFYKGLIQLSGAFVHLQKDRLRPANSLFRLAEANLSKYPHIHEGLDVRDVLALIGSWQKQLESSDYLVNPLMPGLAPRLELQSQ